MEKIFAKDNGVSTYFNNSFALHETKNGYPHYTSSLWLKIQANSWNQTQEIENVKITINYEYLRPQYKTLIDDIQEFVNINKTQFMEKLDQIKMKLDKYFEKRNVKSDYYEHGYNLDEEVKEYMWKSFQDSRTQILNYYNQNEIIIWGLKEFQEKISNPSKIINDMKYEIGEKSHFYKLEIISENEIILPNHHKFFFNIDMNTNYFTNKKFLHINLKIINAIYGSRNESFTFFSEKTKNLFTMNKDEFMENMKKINNRAKTNFKKIILSNENNLEIIWNIFSAIRNEYKKGMEICDKTNKEITYMVKGI